MPADFVYYVRMQPTNQWRVENYVTITKAQAGGYISYHPELPTCLSQGETPKEAEANLAEATMMAIEHLEESCLVVPMPKRFGDFIIDLGYP